jgi:hypothetical protein
VRLREEGKRDGERRRRRVGGINLTLTFSGQVRPRALTFAQTVNPVLFAPYHMDFLHTLPYFIFRWLTVHIRCVTILDIGIGLCIIGPL